MLCQPSILLSRKRETGLVVLYEAAVADAADLVLGIAVIGEPGADIGGQEWGENAV